MAKYKSKFKQLQYVIRAGWVENINNVRHVVSPIVANFSNFQFDTSNCDALNHIKEDELVKIMNDAIDKKHETDFWRIEDDAKMQSAKKKVVHDDDMPEEVTTKGVFSKK